MFVRDMTLATFDPELAQAMAAEERRQESHIELIASENLLDRATNKPAHFAEISAADYNYDARQEVRQPERVLVGDEVHLVPARGERDAEFRGDGA